MHTGVIPQTKSNARCAFHYTHVTAAFQFKSSITAIAHYTRNCKKCSYFPYTLLLQLFFTTPAIFATILYMGNDFHNDFVEKSLQCSVL